MNQEQLQVQNQEAAKQEVQNFRVNAMLSVLEDQRNAATNELARMSVDKKVADLQLERYATLTTKLSKDISELNAQVLELSIKLKASEDKNKLLVDALPE